MNLLFLLLKYRPPLHEYYINALSVSQGKHKNKMW